MRTYEQIQDNFKSIRKPYNDRAGYIASLRAGANKGWIVIYYSKEQGLDDSDGCKYAVVCETHNSLIQVSSLPLARSAMKAPDFCEACYRILRPDLYER